MHDVPSLPLAPRERFPAVAAAPPPLAPDPVFDPAGSLVPLPPDPAGSGRSARADPDAGAGGLAGAVGGGGRPGQSGDRQRQHQGRSDQHEPRPPTLLVGAQADRVQQAPPASERAMPDRLFEVPPRQCGDRDGGTDLQDRADRLDRGVLVDRRLQQVRRSRQHDDRLMPQVDRIRTDAHPAQRLASEYTSKTAGGMGAGRDHEHGADRQQHQATLVQERRVLGGAPDEQDDPDQANHPEPVEDVARARHDLAGQRAARPDHRQRSAEQQPERPRVGPLVDPRVVNSRMEQQRHLERRAGGQHQRDHRQPWPNRDRSLALVHHPEPDQQHPRPDQVELLLDRQRPQMAERRRRAEQREVRDVLADLPPVVDVQQR